MNCLEGVGIEKQEQKSQAVDSIRFGYDIHASECSVAVSVSHVIHIVDQTDHTQNTSNSPKFAEAA